LKVLESK